MQWKERGSGSNVHTMKGTATGEKRHNNSLPVRGTAQTPPSQSSIRILEHNASGTEMWNCEKSESIGMELYNNNYCGWHDMDKISKIFYE